MFMPSVFQDSLFDDLMDSFSLRPAAPKVTVMKTDVRETEQSYALEIELPGYSKEDVRAKLKDGYLTVTAEKNSSTETEEVGKYLRRERYTGSVSRSFYVGDALTEEDVKARFENGILTLELPKEAPQKAVTERFIEIAG